LNPRTTNGSHSRVFGALGYALARLRWVVIAFWAMLALVVYHHTAPLDETTTGRVSDLVPESAPAARAEAETADRLSGPVDAPAVLVFADPEGFDAADVGAMSVALEDLNGPGGPYRLERAVPLLFGGETSAGPDASLAGRKSLPVLLFFERGTTLPGVSPGVAQVRNALDDEALPGTLEAEVTGVRPIEEDNKGAILDNLWLVTGATALAIYLIVAFTYRSPLAPLVPLAAIGLSIFLTLRLISYLASETGTVVPSQVEPIITVLLFGVGTDYALFLMSRARRALDEGAGRIEAARVCVERVGGVLLSSAAVLIAAFALLVVADLGIYKALGPGVALALSTVFLVTITLVPALLAVAGGAAFGAPRRRAVPRTTPGPALRRPGVTAGVLLAGLLVLAAGASYLKVGFDQVENLPDGAPAARGYEMLASGFPPGVLAPVNVLIEGEDIASRPEALRRLESGLLGAGGFAAALGPEDSELLPGVDFASADGSAVRFILVFYGAPYGSEALDQVGRLQRELPNLLDASGLRGATATVGGQTAIAAAARDASAADLWTVAPLVFAVSYGVLALLLRTPVAPFYLLLSTVLSFAATIGLCTVLFQNVLGHGGVVYYVPFALFLLLVALGSDYNIFIMAAIREEARERPLSEAVPLALRRSGPTINAAGLALAASFFLLTLIPLQDFFQVGVAVGVGILLDAFVIRTLLVPALVLLFGPVGFWPAKIRR
jgi:putative drug exporter of the RND superfamily